MTWSGGRKDNKKKKKEKKEGALWKTRGGEDEKVRIMKRRKKMIKS